MALASSKPSLNNQTVVGAASRSESVLPVLGLEPLAWSELTSVVQTGFVLASSLRLEGNAWVAGGDEERSVHGRQVAAVS